MKIIMAGPKCSGKSKIGRMLADNINLPFFETDEIIEQIYYRQNGEKLSCRAICTEIGDDNFRKIEKKAVQEVSQKKWCVVSVGGSTMLNRDSRRLLRKDSILILLYASIYTLLKRLKDLNIPAFLNNQSARDMYAARALQIIEVLKPYADVAVDTTSLSEDKTLTEVLDGLREEIAIRSTTPNTFGQLIRLTTFGESHGAAIGAVLDGLQSGIPISEDEIQHELNRRRPGQSKISTSRQEKDKIHILSGVFEGKTTGTPIGMIINNKDQDSSKYDNIRDLFRPGTADFTFWKKYGLRDHRGAGRSSGRETAGRVMGGAIAKNILKEYGVNITAYTVAVADIRSEMCDYTQIEKNSVRSADIKAAVKMEKVILKAKQEGDSVGGIVQIDISGVPAGLGDPVFGKLDARLGMAVLSIGAVKGVEFGLGFSATVIKGSENNDEMRNGKFVSNNAGGILGGISTGEKIIIRAAIKPTPSIFQKQKTININEKNSDVLIEGRHDPCIVPRIIPVMESMAALVLLDLWKIQTRINPEWPV
jgi:chorismate synthase